MNVTKRDTIVPTGQTKRGRKTIFKKSLKITRRRHMKNSKTKKEKHNKPVQFLQDTDNKASDDYDHAFVLFGF